MYVGENSCVGERQCVHVYVRGVCVCVKEYVFMCERMYVGECIFMCICVCSCVCESMFMCVFSCVRVYSCMCSCVRESMFMCV